VETVTIETAANLSSAEGKAAVVNAGEEPPLDDGEVPFLGLTVLL